MTLKYGFWTNLTVFLTTIPSGILRGYVFATLWSWFVVPLGAPAMGLAHAYGLGCLVTMATLPARLPKDKEVAAASENNERDATAKEKFIYAFTIIWQMAAVSLLTLISGYIAKCLMPS
jgi:hypothetical protein